jgi:hypothetical protein
MHRNGVVLVAPATFLTAILGFSYGTLWAHGCGDMAAVGAVSGRAEFLLYRYQTLIGIGGAIVAALITAQPVWRQFNEMVRQTEGQTLDYLRRHSVEIDREQTLIYAIASSLETMARKLVALAKQGNSRLAVF